MKTHFSAQKAATLLSGMVLLLTSFSASALPSYARQTGESCGACHVGGIGPQLTPHGIKFKIGGYTDSDGKDGHIPLSAMLVANSAHLRKGSQDIADEFDVRSNNNISLQEFSVFLAGRVSQNIGTFAQATYSGIERKTAIDNVDIRFAKETEIGGQPTTWGLTLNNNPTIQDPFNTLPAWRFPYTSADLANYPGASPLLDGGLEQAVIGTTAYAFLNNGLFVEGGAYNNIGRSTLKKLGVEPDAVLDKAAPYARIALFKDLHKQAYSVGLVAMQGNLRAVGAPSGTADKFTDVGLDANYQFLGNRKHIFTIDSSLIQERQTRDAALAAGDADNLKGNLNQFSLAGSYYYNQAYGVTARAFDIRGNADAKYYNPDEFSNGSPNTRGYMLQADWTPLSNSERFSTFLNLRLGLQFTGYTQFNGARRGELIGTSDRRPEDNNLISVFVWGAY